MKKRILKITTILAISAFATIGIKFANNYENPTINLVFANMEALAQGEMEDQNCNITELSKTSDKIVLLNAKNKLGGILAGCKKKCDHTCTVKNSPDIDIEI